jgi:hypothetical protein
MMMHVGPTLPLTSVAAAMSSLSFSASSASFLNLFDGGFFVDVGGGDGDGVEWGCGMMKNVVVLVVVAVAAAAVVVLKSWWR